MRVIGIDPGLRHTGWGIIEENGNILRPIACGVIHPPADETLPRRLAYLQKHLNDILVAYAPDVAAVEDIFMNVNPTSTLKLGMARGITLAQPQSFGIDVFEYSANKVKKTVVGSGHAGKEQVQLMVHHLLPGLPEIPADASDALAVALCHIYHGANRMYAQVK